MIAAVLVGFGTLHSTSTHDARITASTQDPNPGSTNSSSATSPHKKAIPGTSAPAAGPAPRSPAELALQRTLSKALKLAGPQSGAYVYDLDTGAALYSLRADVRRPPASVEKVFTTIAVMRILGPNARLHTSILGTGKLVHGVWHGDLYLRGGGDPTFGDSGFNKVWNQGYGSTAAQLVGQLAALKIKRVSGWVYADESLFDRRRGGLITNYARDIPDFGGQLSALVYDHGTALDRLSPAQFAAREVVLTMRDFHITARASKKSEVTPPDARLLANVDSPQMSVLTRLMDVPSDDLFAELLTKQLGVLFGGAGSIAAGAGVIGRTIASAYSLHPTILDGSGLSRNDRTSPLEIVDLLRDVWRTTTGNELARSLPTVGVNGTVQGIGLRTPAVGRCIAKTGTLTDVTNLVGYCATKDRQNLAFGLFLDGPPNWTATVLESRMIGAIARY